MKRRTSDCRSVLAFLFCLTMPAVAGGEVRASESAITGKLIDAGGTAIPGATVLVFYSQGQAAAAVHSATDGSFTAMLPPGRYVVAAVKRGYEISLTEVYAVPDRVVRLRLQESVAGMADRPRDLEGAGTDWLIRQQGADVLRDQGGAFPVLAAYSPDRAPAGRDLARDLLDVIDGDVVQIFGAGDLLGILDSAGSSKEMERSTALALRAPLSTSLTWGLEGQSGRSGFPLEEGSLASGSDRLAVGVDYGSADRPISGRLRGGFGNDLAGDARVDQRLLEGTGEIAFPGGEHQLVVALRAWSGEADLTGGSYLTLDALGAGLAQAPPMTGEGGTIYTGDRMSLDPSTSFDYGLEYHGDSLSGESRLVPRVGMSRRVAGASDIMVRSELLLDPVHPGGRVTFEGVPQARTQIAASLSLLPAHSGLAADPVPEGAPNRAQNVRLSPESNADSRQIDVALGRDFGMLSGSVSGSVGRTGTRTMPLVESGSVPIVSFGAESFYETRIGVAYKPWETRMEVGYRHVASELDYHQLNLMLSRNLPAPRSLLGARLRALLEWQSLAYDTLLAGNGPGPISGLTSRLSGGVGLSF
jgi:hypothetical protein